MTIRREPHLWCDVCANWEKVNPWLKASQIRAWAKKAGWSRRKRDGRSQDLCPHCTKQESVEASDAG